jgi:hypothetical protein
MMKCRNIDGGNSQVLRENSGQPAPKPALHDPGVWFSDGHPAPLRQDRNLNISGSSPKVVLYLHDTFGMGNIRRTLLLAQDFINEYPGASILIITGSPMIHAFRIPKGIDYIKLPCLDRFAAEQYGQWSSPRIPGTAARNTTGGTSGRRLQAPQACRRRTPSTRSALRYRR